MVIFVMLKWYKLLYYKESLSIYWMTLVINQNLSSNSTNVIKSCVHMRSLLLGANVHPGANLLHRICTTYKGDANSHPGANLHPGAFLLNTVYMTKIHPRCKFTPRVYICTGVYNVHINEA